MSGFRPVLFRAKVIQAGGALFISLASILLSASLADAAQQGAAGSGVRQIGAVKSIQGETILLTTDGGSDIRVTIQGSTRLLRAEPGQADLKSAVPIEFREIQVGDRVLVRGKPSEDGQSVLAAMVVAIKKDAIAQKQAKDREDWQKRGLGGLVKTTDAATQSITITTSALSGSKAVIVRFSPRTIQRRYAPNSVRYEDAKSGTIEEISPGDQFRGRGTRSADGSEFEAEEIITGSFRSIAGTVSTVDAGARTLTVADLITKHPVVVSITPDSTLHVLPAVMAEGIAMRLQGGSPGGGPNGRTPNGQGPPAGGGQPPSGPPPGGPPEGGRGQGQFPGGPPRNGPSDFQTMISRLPAATLDEFSQGEAVMIVATKGNDPSQAVAINVVGGVEPLLRASPEGSQEMMLSPWNLGGPAPEGGTQ